MAYSGRLPPPSPPSEQAATGEDETGKSRFYSRERDASGSSVMSCCNRFLEGAPLAGGGLGGFDQLRNIGNHKSWALYATAVAAVATLRPYPPAGHAGRRAGSKAWANATPC